MKAYNITQAVVCGTTWLQAVCKLLACRTRLSWRHSAIYSTLTNNALHLWAKAAPSLLAYELKMLHVAIVQGRSKLHRWVGHV